MASTIQHTHNDWIRLLHPSEHPGEVREGPYGGDRLDEYTNYWKGGIEDMVMGRNAFPTHRDYVDLNLEQNGKSPIHGEHIEASTWDLLSTWLIAHLKATSYTFRNATLSNPIIQGD